LVQVLGVLIHRGSSQTFSYGASLVRISIFAGKSILKGLLLDDLLPKIKSLLRQDELYKTARRLST
jgi:hypothetical protein